jgi:spermidine synthase
VIIERFKDGRRELALRETEGAFELIIDGQFAVSTAEGWSERELVTAAVKGVEQCRLLIAGLGLGHSLAQAVSLGNIAQIVVVERERCVIEWVSSYLGGDVGSGLSDPRVQVVCADIRRVLDGAKPRFDAICLDVDNGPSWLLDPVNGELYSREGLAALRRALRPGGRAAIWASDEEPVLFRELSTLFARVDVHRFPVRRGAPDVVYVARETIVDERNPDRA